IDMILVEKIEAFLNEKIRTKKGLPKRDPAYDASPAYQDDRFKWNTFIKIDDYYERMTYARRFLELLGVGSSRYAYRLSTDKVLKISVDEDRGVAQNEAEVAAYTNPDTRKMVTKIFDFDSDNYEWLVSEAVRPVTKADLKK